MQLVFESKELCARRAKMLKRELSGYVPSVKLSDAQNAIGRMFGYRNWHEFEIRGIGSPASPPDAALAADERIRRRRHQADVLIEVFKLPRDLAEKIVERVGPSGTELSVVTPLWRSKLNEEAWKDALVGHESLEEQILRGLHWSLEKRVRFKNATVADLGVIKYAINKVHGFTVGERFEIRSIAAGIVRDGRITAALDGYIIKVLARTRRDAIEDPYDVLDDLFVTADGVENDLGRVMGAFVQHAIAEEYLLRGKDMLVLTSLTRNFQRSSKGDGVNLVEAVVNLVNAQKGLQVDTLLLPKDVFQFSKPEAHATKAGREAAKYLFGRLMPALQRVADVIITVDAGSFDEFSDIAQRMLATHGSEEIDRSTIEMVSANTLRLEKYSGKNATRTLEGEPASIDPEELKDGFNFAAASCFTGLNPHPNFWSWMPSDLMAVRLEKTGEQEQVGRMTRPALMFKFRFRNGTELEMPSSFVAGGQSTWFPIPALTGPGLVWLIQNPFTDRMRSVDLHAVLTLNVLLLFGEPSQGASEPLPRASEVRRPA